MASYYSGYHGFKLYMAIKRHFESKAYCIFKFQGAIKYSEEKFESRFDSKMYYNLAYEYRKGDLKDFFMANVLAGKKHVSEYEDVTYREWKSKIQNINNIFEKDLTLLANLGNIAFRDLFKTNGGLPIVLQALNGGHINKETICLINLVTDGKIVEQFDSSITDTLSWPAIRQSIIKYQPFIRYDNEVISKLLQKHL